MEKEGALAEHQGSKNVVNINNSKDKPVSRDIEGMKCKAPHTHQWGDVAYHNAMVCSLVNDDDDEETKVRIF